MRPVDKGLSPREYSAYPDACDDLANRIGRYCSYCEMPIWNMPEVEHVVPLAKGGAELDWKNFLLSCKYCNTRKGDRNCGREGYLWPDRDNTFRAFEYFPGKGVESCGDLPESLRSLAAATIALIGLDWSPGSGFSRIGGKRRWESRDEAWLVAALSRDDWRKVPTREMACQIALTVKGHGHFSIWMKVFCDVPEVRREIIRQYPGTAAACFDPGTTNSVPRPGGAL